MMKAKDIKVGKVVFCTTCKNFFKITGKKLWHGELVISLNGESLSDAEGQGHTLDVLRSLTKREKGD